MSRIVKNIFQLLIITLLIINVSYFGFIDQLSFWRLIYPLQAKLSILNIKCSSSSPVWMKDTLKYIINNQKNLSNQIVYIDKNKNIYNCESGWISTAFFSETLSENTRFRYASLTKLFTSDAILNQIDQGKFTLDTKLVDLVPELQKKRLKDNRINSITIGQLLEHRSGFDRMSSEDVVFALDKKSWCPYDLKKIASLVLDFSPDQRYAYDNRNYCILGRVLELALKEDYRSYINNQYSLQNRNIKFVDGYYFSDEVRYDFRNSDFWMESDVNRFDFYALSSSAGLSGSTKQLAISIQKMLDSKKYTILSINDNTLKSCKINQFKSCNGYGMWQYRQTLNKPVMYFRNGGLPGLTSLAMVTENKEVIVWAGNGQSFYTENYDENFLEKYFYKIIYADK